MITKNKAECGESLCAKPIAFRVIWFDPAGFSSDLCRDHAIDAAVLDGKRAPDVKDIIAL